MASELKDDDLGIPTKVHSREPAELKPIVERILADEFPERAGLKVTRIDVPTGAGVANETLLLDVAWDGGAEGLVLRLDSDDKLFTEPAFADHFRLYRAIGEAWTAPVPRVFGYGDDPAPLGSAYFFMERVAGRVPTDQPPFHSSGWVTEVAADDRRTMWRNAVEALARLHTTPTDAVSFLARPGAGSSGFEQELDYNLRYMGQALGGGSHRVIEYGARWLEQNLPAVKPTGFSWGDSRPQNIIFDGTRVAAILDWDMASLAGPEADLAWWTLLDFSMTRSRGVPRLAGWGSPRETMALWEELSGRALADMHYHFVFAAFRGAVIVMKLAKMLDARGHLPPGSRDWIDNSMGVQYLAALLEIEPFAEGSLPWPGID